MTTILQKIMNHSSKFSKNLDKENAKNSAYPKCNQFCNNEFINKKTKQMKQIAKITKTKYILPKKNRKFMIEVCKKTFCNPKCNGYKDLQTKEFNKKFTRKNKTGYNTDYTPAEIKKLKSKGALSGCVNMPEFYNTKL